MTRNGKIRVNEWLKTPDGRYDEEFIGKSRCCDRILNVDWEKVQAFSQSGITWVVNAITHVSNTIDAAHSELSNVGIPLVSGVSAGFVLGIVRG